MKCVHLCVCVCVYPRRKGGGLNFNMVSSEAANSSTHSNIG